MTLETLGIQAKQAERELLKLNSLKKNACLMANHGVVAIGGTLPEAYTNSVYVEDAAKIYHLALCSGHPVVIKEYEEV